MLLFFFTLHALSETAPLTFNSSHVSFLWLSCSARCWKRLHTAKLFITAFTSFFFPVIIAEPPVEIVAYVGDVVTLPSGGNFSPSKIVWSILSNNTAIARYKNRKMQTELFHQYSNRLSLNELTGEYTHLSKWAAPLFCCSRFLIGVSVL